MSPALQVCPKGPFSGSEVAFSVAIPEGAAAAEKALDILSLVQVWLACSSPQQHFWLGVRLHRAGINAAGD